LRTCPAPHPGLSVIALTLALGCGGEESSTGSGLDRSLPLSSLDHEQRLELCEWNERRQHESLQSPSCVNPEGDELPFYAEAVTECAEAEKLFGDCSVGLFEDCALASSEDICHPEPTEACDAFSSCVESSTAPPNVLCLGPYGCEITCGQTCKSCGYFCREHKLEKGCTDCKIAFEPCSRFSHHYKFDADGACLGLK